MAQLDQDLIATDYNAAVAKGVAGKGGKAFVVESKALASDLFGDGVLGELVPAGHTITRLSSVLAPADLDADVSFTSKAPPDLAAPIAFAGVMMPPASSSSSSDPLRALGDASLLLALSAALLVVRGRGGALARVRA